MNDASDQGTARRLTVHLGVQKTGSTSLQRHLARNEALLAQGLVLRLPAPGTPMQALGRAAVAFSLDPDANAAALSDALGAVRDGLPADDRPVLLSHENLAGAMPGNGGEAGLYPALPRIVALLDRAFAGFAVDYVVYSRRMGSWKPSVWAQAVRTDGYTGTWDDFQQATAALPGWSNLMRRLETAAGKDRLTHFRLEDEADPAQPARRLLAHAGVDAPVLSRLAPVEGRAMQRLPAAATEFIRRLNGIQMNPHARYKVVELAARLPQLFNPDDPSAGLKAEGQR